MSAEGARQRNSEEKIWYQSYQKGIPHEINPHEFSSLAELLDYSFNKFADRPNFHNMGKTLTYREIDVLSRKFASYLQNTLNLDKGERIALMMPNILQYPVCLFGALRAGLTAVNVNPLYTARELEHQLQDSEAKAIVIFENSASLLEKILPKTKVKHVLITKIGDFLPFPKSLLVNSVIKYVKKMVPAWNIPQATSLQAALSSADAANFVRPKLTHDDIAFLQYTGGTTGVAKGAILTHGNVVANLLQAKAWLSLDLKEGEDIIITPLPLYHIFSLTANCFTFSFIGALNILITNPRDIPGFIKELEKWKFTAITGVNTLYNALLSNPKFKTIDFSSLRIALGGGMAVQKVVAEKWKAATGKPLVEAYGLTETSPAACINPLNIEEYTGAVGLPIPSTEVTIKDEEENNLAIGEVGEICIKGPQVMLGYWRRPDETAKVMTSDQFFKTGDMGLMDEKGYVRIVDRKKDMILVSGFNVYPNEIEAEVAKHPKVFEAAAVGLPDEKSGEVVKLFVVASDKSLTEDEIIKHCRESLTAYKVPKFVEFRDDLPKSNVGKILRKELRDQK